MFRGLFVLLIFSLLAACGERAPIDDQTYPWQIKITEKGNSQVFGVELDAMPLGHAARVLQKRYELGLFENNRGELYLEAYFDEITRGGLSGKLIVLLQADKSRLNKLKSQSVKKSRQESGEIKYTLSLEDKKTTEQLIVTGISYIPYVQLDKQIIEQRFGVPDRVVTAADKLNHYLYMKKGLDIIQNEDGKELLQFVSPHNMQRLLKPLQD